MMSKIKYLALTDQNMETETRVVDDKVIKNSLIVFYVLSIAPLMYLLLLYLLLIFEVADSSEITPDPETENLLRIVLGAVMVLVALLVASLLEPKVREVEKFNNAFSMSVIVAIGYESVGTISLIFGLLQLFVFTGSVDMLFVAPPIVLSSFLMLAFVFRTAKPTFEKLKGTEYDAVVNQ